MTGIRLDWKAPNESDWQSVLNKIPRSSIFQDWHIGVAIAKAEKMEIARALIYREANAIGLCQLYIQRHWLGIKSARMIRGPLFSKLPGSSELMEAMRQCKTQYPLTKGYWTTLLPELPDTDATQKTLSDAGLNRIMTGYQSIWLNLASSTEKLRTDLHPKWRNQLGKAEKNALEIVELPDISQLLAQHKDHMKQAGFHALPPETYGLIPTAQKLCLSARKDGQDVASLLILRHGRAATYQIGWTKDIGRSLHATNLLLWRAILILKEKEISWLDLGGVEPTKNPGLARFKERVGGEKFTLAGTYL
ncbi:GNAT family N-acetyltransferase [Aestuariispira insulae]|uniref:FemAB family protein n=1 Tax=Aestuariispira insulae TaxID=1461337 RepID=A0A3D9HWX5_9PROT|nr:GNAT family N-acetyltransferase [Aestuariispira insulae]RED53406.1 FemAB family protein [Aestuariispira insulae]